jgi:hypothetical protein
MALREQPSHELISRLRACGVNATTSRQIVAQFNQWRQASGDEWTCSHIKDLKVDLIRHMGNQKPISTWIARRKDKVTPRGPFGALWALSRNKPFTALNAMNIYTSLVYDPLEGNPKVTPKQVKGFVEAVHRPRPSSEAEQAYKDLVKDLPSWEAPWPDFQADPLLDVPIKPFKRSPIPGRGLVAKEKVFPRAFTVLSLCPPFYRKHKKLLDSTLGLTRDLIPLLDITSSNAIRRDDPIPVLLNKIVLQMEAKDGHSPAPSDVISGRVSFIQDSGYKLRHVFVTNELLQLASLPLQQFLMNRLKDHPQDYTYDQEKGVHVVQDLLKQGLTLYCFDLQKCSDNLPRSMQMHMLSQHGCPNEWIEWFKDITGGLWELDDLIPAEYPNGDHNPLLPDYMTNRSLKKVRGNRMRMTVGQQLGFGPSFPAFALLHHSIVDGIYSKLRIPKLYGLVGDDLFLTDARAASMYQWFMGLIGVPISMSKSIVSDRIA